MPALTDSRVGWARSACARILGPVVKLALALGLKHRDLDDMLRELLLKEAQRQWRDGGIEPNISQLSMATGLNRKVVAARLLQAPLDALPGTQQSAAAKTLARWLQLRGESARHRSLPIAAGTGDEPSFEALANRASRGNVHHRAVLDELVRLGMAQQRGDAVELTADAFIPSNDLQTMLTFLADNARDHLLAGVANTLDCTQPPLLERAIYAKGLSLDECQRIHEMARRRWGELHDEVAATMRDAFEDANKSGTARVRVGIYTYVEDVDAQPPPPALARGARRKGTGS